MSYNEAIWPDWYSVAEPLNRLVPWLTIGLSTLWWAVYPIQQTGTYMLGWLVAFLPGLIMGLLSGFLYYLILQQKIDNKNLENPTLIWLLICFGLSIPTLGGIIMWVQFALVGVLSERPVWKLFTEKSYRYY